MEEKADAGAVRVLTLNPWGRSGEWDERRSVLADGLRELRPVPDRHAEERRPGDCYVYAGRG